jgi:hypothetical protein
MIDEEKRREWPFYKANKRVFDMEKSNVMEEIPRGFVSVETLQENSLLGAQALSALQEVESYLSYTLIYSPEHFDERVSTGIFTNARSKLIEYINNLKFRVIPELNRTRDRSLASQTSITLDKIYKISFHLKQNLEEAEKTVSNYVVENQQDPALFVKYGTLLEVLSNEKVAFTDLFNQITQLRGIVQSRISAEIKPLEKQEELKQEEVKDNLPDVNEAFQEDQNLDELGNEEHLQFDAGEDVGAGYDPIRQQKSQFEAGEKRFRDEMKQDEDDLEGMGLRFRLAKTKNKKR